MLFQNAQTVQSRVFCKEARRLDAEKACCGKEDETDDNGGIDSNE